ncbi:MAG: sigma-70 family RNA polymerase sigma factor [Gemmatimonadetes bacterium]|nr:sigma-70 family RNA polymerase sigma factor [Gemmatimonadota bacterium]
MAVTLSNRAYIRLVVLHFGLPGDYVGIVLGAIRDYHARNGHLRPFLEEDLQDVAIDLILELGRGPWRNARGKAIDSGASEGMRYFKVALRNRLYNFVTRELPAEPEESYDSVPEQLAEADGEKGDLPSVRDIQAAIRTLDFVDRAVAGYMIEGFPQRDIARITGLSKSNLNRRVQAIRATLSRLLSYHP